MTGTRTGSRRLRAVSPTPRSVDLISLVVLQPTSLCNMNCRYCYVPNRRDATIMPDGILEAVIVKALRSRLVEDCVEFLFHAGEPLTAGRAFYERAADLIDCNNPRGIRVAKAIQTNATLINDEWCRLFKTRNYHIGVSIDGPQLLHDNQRTDWAGKGTFHAVKRGIDRLNEHEIAFGAICVLTRESLAHPEEMFHFFLDNGFPSVGFNIEEIESANRSSSMISADRDETRRIHDEFVRFIERFHDLWEADGRRLKVREFFDMAVFIQRKLQRASARRIPDETADFGIITVQKNGDMTPYSPEFAGSPSETYRNFVVGNILESSFDDVSANENFARIRDDVHASLRMCASSCRYFDLCGGAFLSNKFWQNGTLFSTETATCRLTRQAIADLVIDRWSRPG
jgi:uncharacterized protein